MYQRNLVWTFWAVGKETVSISLLVRLPRRSIVIINIIEGAGSEALDAHPGKCILHIKQRKGFVRIALKTGFVFLICE